MKRRDFLKAAVGGATTLCTVGVAEARPNLEPTENAVGMLYDSTLCIGCKACVSKCKEVNDMPPTMEGDNTTWDSAHDLSGETLNVIKIYKDGTARVKDSVVDGFAFEKRSCMHCVDPGCVSACPCTAMRRDSLTGIVTHHADACIGCRNCMVACPYNVPQFEYNKLFGQIHKCQMCNQAGVERISKGGMTGCAEVCPTGATLFGTRKDLLAEAKRRMTLKAGEVYSYPRGNLSDPFHPHEKAVPHYRNHIWGEKEAGGTNVMHISSVPFDRLGMPPLEERSAASIAESVQHTIYNYMALPAIALAGLTFAVRRNTEDDDHEGGES
ncbi:MAG: hydrogenase 2 operon protein HybA [Candidatus Sedimenticola sp. (ex Thyasira tokunagai)]